MIGSSVLKTDTEQNFLSQEISFTKWENYFHSSECISIQILTDKILSERSACVFDKSNFI